MAARCPSQQGAALYPCLEVVLVPIVSGPHVFSPVRFPETVHGQVGPLDGIPFGKAPWTPANSDGELVENRSDAI